MIGSWPTTTSAQKGGENDMPEPLTSRQREILEYLRFRQKIRSYPPTVREIGEAVGLSSSSTVQNHLNTLERKGYIRRDPTKSRTIEVVDIDEVQAKLSKVVAVPLIGRVAAGQPILADENIEDHLVLSQELIGTDNAFALEVHGDSMKDVGILQGDYVVVRPGKDAPNGSIVVARLEDEQTNEPTATVKRLFREANRVRLQPENDSFEPIYTTSAVLEGQVVALVRLLR
jgi:repressor LexA